LIDITSRLITGIEDGRQVVRWCEDCGAVVVDAVIDGRTYPGDIKPMRFPQLAQEADK
jgi:hypothetical protein